MAYIYSTYDDNICFVNNNEELILSKYDGSNEIIINIDGHFVSNIIDIILCKDYIILHTITDDIFYYDIEKKKLNFLINSFVIRIKCGYYTRYEEEDEDDNGGYIHIGVYNILIASDKKIMLYVDFELSREFIIPSNDNFVNFFSAGRGYHACVSSEKTFILYKDLSLVGILDKPYKSIVKMCTIYYCLFTDECIDIYETWRYKYALIDTISLKNITSKKIISIHKYSNILALVDEENNYYQMFNCEFDNIDDFYIKIAPLDFLCSLNNHHFFIFSGKKYLSILKKNFSTIIIFDSVTIVIYKVVDVNIWSCSYKFNNIVTFKSIDKFAFVSIDTNNIVRWHDIIDNNDNNNNNNNIFTNIIKCTHQYIKLLLPIHWNNIVDNNSQSRIKIITNVCEYEIKTQCTTRVKSAKNIM